MSLNADFDRRVLVHSTKTDWVPSPMRGVDRRMLDRIGDEVARATSIVRYAPGSQFSAHTHTGGEEFIVLEGTFQDEHGDFPEGTYVRNPPTTSHTPGSAEGCVIFVKLWQFDLSDRTQVRLDMNTVEGVTKDGVTRAILHKDARETVSYLTIGAGRSVSIPAAGGLEALVIDGSMTETFDDLTVGSWLRLPDGDEFKATAGPNGAKVWIKTGHLPFAKPPAV